MVRVLVPLEDRIDPLEINRLPEYIRIIKRSETVRQKHGHTGRQADRETERQTGRQTDRKSAGSYIYILIIQ